MAFKSDLPTVPDKIAEAMIPYTTERAARLSFDKASPAVWLLLPPHQPGGRH